MTPTLVSVTRSQEGLTTFAQYKVSIRNPNAWGLGLIQGKFNASTSVLPWGTRRGARFLDRFRGQVGDPPDRDVDRFPPARSAAG